LYCPHSHSNFNAVSQLFQGSNCAILADVLRDRRTTCSIVCIRDSLSPSHGKISTNDELKRSTTTQSRIKLISIKHKDVLFKLFYNNFNSMIQIWKEKKYLYAKIVIYSTFLKMIEGLFVLKITLTVVLINNTLHLQITSKKINNRIFINPVILTSYF